MIYEQRRAHFGAHAKYLLLAALLVVGSAFGEGAMAGLLAPALAADSASVASASGPLPLGATRSRLVRVDLDELSGHVAPLGADRAANRVERAASLDGVIEIELFPDASATFRRTGIDAAGDSGYAWSGDASAQSSSVTLIVDNGQITGAVQIGARYFVIEPVAGGLHRVSEIDRGKYPANASDYVIPNSLPRAGPPAREPTQAVTKTTIRLLAAFTPAARTQAPNVVNLVKLAVAQANKAYTNTRIPITLVLAGTMGTGAFNEGADTSAQWQKVLNQVTGFAGAGVLANVRAKRNQLKADLVALIVKNSAIYCGLAWLIETPSAATSEYGFSEQAVGCLAGGTVMPHELGHNMGLRHDRFTNQQQGGGNPPNSLYNFGFVNKAAKRIDIMGYISACTLQGIQGCTYVPWFSTSQFKYNGTIVLGIAKNRPGAADATRRLGETRTGIASYR